MPKYLPPPVWLLISIIAMVGLWHWLPGGAVLAYPWTLLGIVPMAIGIALGLPAALRFRRQKTTLNPFEVSSRLVTEGPLRFTRNPMYLGLVLILIGVALLTGAVTPFIVIVAFALIINYGFIRREEKMLGERFGDEYRRYAARVRRWV